MSDANENVGPCRNGDTEGHYSPILLPILLAAYSLSYVDRQIFNILANPIAVELRISDTQIGLLGGLAFALFYSSLGVPLAIVVDRLKTDRIRVMSASLCLFSGFTIASGFARSFFPFMAARTGVGLGEAGIIPAAHSLIGDVVPIERRGKALAVFGLGVPVGTVLGLSIGGVIGEWWGWRWAYLAVGLPGVLLALGMGRLLIDPRRGGLIQKGHDEPASGIALRDTFKAIVRSRALTAVFLATAVVAFVGYGNATWAAVYFVRTKGLSLGEAGIWLGLVAGTAGSLGTWIGGVLCDKVSPSSRRHCLAIATASLVLMAPFQFAAFSVSDWRLALLLFWPALLCQNVYYAPSFLSIHWLIPGKSRALATAFLVMFLNLCGLGFGPLVYGVLSDMLRPHVGDDSVRTVMLLASSIPLVAAMLYWRAACAISAEDAECLSRIDPDDAEPEYPENLGGLEARDGQSLAVDRQIKRS